MFKAIRIGILLLLLFFVSVSTWLTQSRSTDWNNSLWVKIYPINGDGSEASRDYIDSLSLKQFEPIEQFLAREIEKFGHSVSRPVRMELGQEIREQPPVLGPSPNTASIMWWSLKLRSWASSVTDGQDNPDPDVRIFVRYHAPSDQIVLENSVGLQKGMVGIVNAYASRRHTGANNVIEPTAGTLQRLGNNFNTAFRLAIGIPHAYHLAVSPNRRGPGHHDVFTDTDRPAVSDLCLPRRTGMDVFSGHH